jgi:hypothetical protein
VVIILSVIAGGSSLAQAPAVTHAVPSAAAPGKTTEVKLHGSGLKDVTQVWASFPGAAAAVAGSASASGNEVTVKFELPADVPAGFGALRVATRSGASNLVPFLVDDVPTVAEAGGNASPGGAQAISPPVAVDGTCEPLVSNYFRFAARKGERVAVEVVAARVGSALDPVIRLLDASGRELAWCDDGAGAAPDARLAHTFPADGEYLIELRDAGHEGGPQHRYRLRVGDFPLATAPYPLGARRGAAASFTFVGEDCAAAAPVTVQLPQDGRRQPLSVRHPGGKSSGFASVVLGDSDESAESEPNDAPDSATPLALPSATSGRLDPVRDRDHYQLQGKKGQRVLLRARTRSLGSPCDLLLQLFKPDGSRLASSKVQGESKGELAPEGSLDATFPEDGPYRLRVEDLNGAGGPGLAYRIEADPFRPGFSLSVETDKVDAKPTGQFEIKVTCARRDYGGPITLAIDGIGPGVGLEGNTIPAGKNETQLKVKLPSDLKAGTLLHFQIRGTAKAGDHDFSAAAGTTPALRKLFPGLLYPPEGLDGPIALGVRAE